MGWDSVVSTLTNAAQSTAGFGVGVVSGVKSGATSLFDGVVSLGSGALSAVKATGRAAIDPAYREQKMAEASDLARRAADYGGQLYDDPATRREAWDTVQSAVGSIKEKYVAARDAAAAKGQLSEFYGGLVGRGGFEVAGLLVPVTKLGALGKVGAAAEGAADLQKAAKVGGAMTATKAGAVVTECAEAIKPLHARIQELIAEGHGVQRHGAQVTDIQLQGRAVQGLDPMTGTRVDGVHGGLHQYAQHATKVVSDDAYVFAENYGRSSQQFTDAVSASTTGRAQLEIPLKEIYGDDFRSVVSGVTRYGPKAAPTGFGNTVFGDDSYMIIRYKQNSNGAWEFNTMFPQPD